MRRIGRILLNVATGVSLLLCAVVVALWGRSYSVSDTISDAYGDPGREIHIGCGQVELAWWPHRHQPLGTYGEPDWTHTLGPPTRFDRQWDRLGVPNSVVLGCGYADDFTEPAQHVVFGLWLPALLLFLIPFLRLNGVRRCLARKAAAGTGPCPACGYDLRATPDRCPECGTVVGERSEHVKT